MPSAGRSSGVNANGAACPYACVKSTEVAGEELDELAKGDGDEGEEGTPDSGVPAGSTYFPSSMRHLLAKRGRP